MTTSKDISTLNTLIATLLDSVEGYRTSAADIDNADLAARFTARADERQSCVADLQSAVVSGGGKPEDESTLLGGAHRMFLKLKEAIAGRDDKAIIAEIERGEDHLKHKFESALADDELSPSTRVAIREAWQSVKAGHDEMSALKHGYPA